MVLPRLYSGKARAALVALAILATSLSPVGAQDGAAIDQELIRVHTRVLSHDSLLGRGTATAGSRAAAHYIEAACQSLGLHPLRRDLRFRLPVPLLARTYTENSRLVLTDGDGRSTSFAPRDNFTVEPGLISTPPGFRGRAVFVGSSRDIAATLPTAGSDGPAVAVVVGGLRPRTAGHLARNGFTGVLILFPTAEGYEAFQRSQASEPLVVADSTVVSSYRSPLPTVVAGPEITRVVVQALRDAGSSKSPQALALEVAATLIPVDEPRSDDNVGCLLPGRRAGDTVPGVIALTAHYDHLGVGPPVDGDSIYNGFSDNAAGVAMLLAIADALTGAGTQPLRHDVVFLFFTGEEAGLLGSDHFVAHLPWPADRVHAVINLDAGAPPAVPSGWRVAGGATWLRTLAVRIGRTSRWTMTVSGASPNTDYYPFWRLGIPSVFLVPGPGPYEGLSADSSDALRRKWDHYHEPNDHWSAAFDFRGLGRYAAFALAIVRAADTAAQRGVRSEPGGNP